MPEIPIAIATDVEPKFEFDHVIDISDPAYGFVDQIDNLQYSPFEKTIHFDSDIYAGTDITGLGELLSQFDIAVAHNHNREVYDLPSVPASFPEYNTGVVVYRNNDQFHDFTQAWKENYLELVTNDNTQNQPSFRITLFESDLRVATLTPEYNCMVRYPGHVRNTVKIAHSRLLDISTPGASKSVNVPDALETLNQYGGHRLYEPDGSSGVSILRGRVPKDAPLYKKGIDSLRIDGVVHTIKRGIPFLIDRLRGTSD